MTTVPHHLLDAARQWVTPGMHLHFASTPSRSNAAIRAVVEAFSGTDPGFVLSATGFHSTAHLLAMERLGRRYIASFYGDNYPGPRPNRLYSTLQDEGAAIEVWSLGTMVAGFRAGALGTGGTVSRSLSGSDLGRDLAQAGRITLLGGPEDGVLVRPLRPDITFVHGLVADDSGRVVLPPPWCEGTWSALAARTGVIATVEKIVPAAIIDDHPHLVRIPPHRILELCVAPGGALPQPVPGLAGVHPGYDDDFAAYQDWRTRSLEALPRSPARRRPRAPEDDQANVHRILLAAREIVQRVRSEGHQAILAGIGQSFIASRIAGHLLAEQGCPVPVMVETGLYDLPPLGAGHAFLLARSNMQSCRRLSDVEDVLSTLTGGADARCLGVIGAGQIDPSGAVNSTWTSSGRLLVGSGGANDIASAAAEVLVLAPFSPGRLVPQVHHITSPGRAVSTIVTECGVIRREDRRSTRWTLHQQTPLWSDRAPRPWTEDCLQIAPDRADSISPRERELLELADPECIYWRRSAECRPSESQAREAISRAG